MKSETVKTKPSTKVSTKAKTRVVITGPIRNASRTLEDHLKHIEGLDTSGLEITYHYLTYQNDDNTLEILKDFIKDKDNAFLTERTFTNEEMGVYVPHFWDLASLLLMQKVRTDCLNLAQKYSPDYVYMADSDVMVHPKSLKRLVEINDKGVSSNLLMKTFDKDVPHVNFGLSVLDQDYFTPLLITADAYDDMPKP